MKSIRNMHNLHIPEPFRSEKFALFKKGISDNPSIDVYMNDQEDFAFLYPAPKTDYDNYVPRVIKYGLTTYKNSLNLMERRLNKIVHLLGNGSYSLLEIGAGDGSFLQTVRQHRPNLQLTAVDKDQNTLKLRKNRSDNNYSSLQELFGNSINYDFICLFHVIEHILYPSDLFKEIQSIMIDSSLLIIEVPSLFDPLLSLYKSEAYFNFYFQSQHPYIYSQSSLQRLLEYNDFQTIELINHQRYGLENHLNWLFQGRPGGNETLQELFKGLEAKYIEILEKYGKTDTAIWIGKKSYK
jgi:SAM-dependent methyltransferase